MANRKFDLHKEPKRKFNLSKDYDDEEDVAAPSAPTRKIESEPVATQSPAAEPVAKPKKGYGKIIGAIIGGIVVVGIIIWLVGKFGGPQSEPEATVTETAESVEPAATQDDEPEISENEIEEPSIPEEEVSAPEATVTTEATEASTPKAETPKAEATATTSPAKSVPAPTASQAPSGDVDAKAIEVIKGKYGNGSQRRASLGADYAAVQARVNQLKNQGKF